jgi:hypothetical protein
VPTDWPALRSRALSPVILCGHYLIAVFCLSVFLTFAAQSVFVEISDSVPVHLLAAALGIGTMAAVALFLAWFEPLTTRGPDKAQRNAGPRS